MNTFWVKNKYRIIGAGGLMILYAFLMGVIFVLAPSQGDNWALLIVFLNPVYLVFAFTPLGKLVEPMGNFGILMVILGGLLSYGFLGWLIGPVLERFDPDDQKHREKNNK